MSNKPNRKSVGVEVGTLERSAINHLFEFNMTSEFDRFTTHCNTLLKCHGKQWTTARLKAYYVLCTKLALGHKTIEAIPFTKSDKDGFPKGIKYLKKHILSPDVNCRRGALTLLRSYTKIYDSPSKDYSSITTPASSDVKRAFYAEYQHEFDKILDNLKKLNPRITDSSLFTTSKAGPNGHAMLEVDKDLFAIKGTPLLDSINKMHQLIGDLDSTPRKPFDVSLERSFASDFDEEYGDSEDQLPRLARKLRIQKSVESMFDELPERYNDKLVSGRIGLISEGGCKTRVIAISDWFSQDALKPIHQWCYRFLKRLKTDGTFSHNRVSELLKEQTAKGGSVYCFDLTSATDRFPVFLQKDLLERMLGSEISQTWYDIVCKREFATESGMIRYAVGQPMGLLSSWPVFALTHHAIIETAALKVGYKSYRRYVVIGDDVAIFDSCVAHEYENMLRLLEVPISKAKSMFSEGKPSSGEIAKRLFLDGVEVSPLPHDAIQAAIKDFRLYPNLIRLCHDRGIGSTSMLTPVQKLRDLFYKRKAVREAVDALLTFPASGSPFGVNHDDKWMSFPKAKALEKFNIVRMNYIKRRARELYTKDLAETPDMGHLGWLLENPGGSDIAFHPLFQVLRAYRDRCGSIFQGILLKNPSVDDYALIPYLINPLIPSFVRRTHQIEKIRSSLILETLKELREEKTIEETIKPVKAKTVLQPWLNFKRKPKAGGEPTLTA